MRILITGAGGQVGTDVAAHCRGAHDDVVALDRAHLDVGDRDAVLTAVLGGRPDVIVNAAAWTAVDACESDPERAFRDNALGARWVAEAARRAGSYLIQVSTDYVFDGTKEGPYHEWDEPAPTSVYGASKWAGEREVLASGADCAVVRTSWVVGEHGHNMVKTVLGLRHRPALRFVDDQRGRPTFTADLAVGLRRLAAARLPGVFHLTNDGDTTWFGFAREVLAAAGADPGIVEPVSTAAFLAAADRPVAPRPANSVLDGVAWRGSLLPELPHYRDRLRTTVTHLLGAEAPEEPS